MKSEGVMAVTEVYERCGSWLYSFEVKMGGISSSDGNAMIHRMGNCNGSYSIVIMIGSRWRRSSSSNSSWQREAARERRWT